MPRLRAAVRLNQNSVFDNHPSLTEISRCRRLYISASSSSWQLREDARPHQYRIQRTRLLLVRPQVRQRACIVAPTIVLHVCHSFLGMPRHSHRLFITAIVVPQEAPLTIKLLAISALLWLDVFSPVQGWTAKRNMPLFSVSANVQVQCNEGFLEIPH